MASSKRTPAENLLYRFWTTEKIRNPDTDRFGHVNNNVIMSFFEAGRIEVFDNAKIQKILAGTNVLVAKLQIDFKRELFYPGKVHIGSTVTRIGNSSFDFDQAIFAAGDLIAISEATCVLIDSDLKQPRRLPNPLQDFLMNNSPLRTPTILRGKRKK